MLSEKGTSSKYEWRGVYMSKYRIILDGKTYEMEIERIDGQNPVKQKPETKPVAEAIQVPTATTQIKTSNAVPTQAAGESAVRSPMPGTIIRVNVAPGDTVKKGQSVLVLEAMKMENDIAAPKDGKITALHVAQGDTVQGGSVLFEIVE